MPIVKNENINKIVAFLVFGGPRLGGGGDWRRLFPWTFLKREPGWEGSRWLEVDLLVFNYPWSSKPSSSHTEREEGGVSLEPLKAETPQEMFFWGSFTPILTGYDWMSRVFGTNLFLGWF